MIGLKRELIYDLLKLIDMLIVAFCLFAAITIANFIIPASDFSKAFTEMQSVLSERISLTNVFILIFFIISWHIVFSYMGFYTSRRLYTLHHDLWDVAKGITIITMILFVSQIIYPMQIVNLLVLQFFWLISLLIFVLCRLILRFGLQMARKKGRNLRKALIIGSNDRAISYAEKIVNNSTFGYEIIGFVDTDWHSTTKKEYCWCNLVTNFKNFPEYLRDNIIDEVFILLPFKSSYMEIADVVSASEDQGVTIRLVPDFFNLQIARSRIETIEDEPILSLYTGAMNRKLVFLKEVFDSTISGVLLLFFLPLLIIIAISIRLTSKGPIFFIQKRLGYNKRIFHIIKFRTMIPDAENKLKDLEYLNDMGVNAGAFKLKNDPRITPIGKFLRKYSLDELPQIINVFKGDMSLVGPRPLTERDYREFKINRQIRRFSVKPGITCLWQISGRNGISFDQWMEYDMQYIDEWNLMLDIKILLKTIPAVITGYGAS